MSKLHVVVTCTDRKTVPIDRGPRAAQLPKGTLETRIEAWTNALGSSRQDPIPAGDLYAGDHWSVVRSMRTVVPPDVDLRVWICSAGYGLISPNSFIRPYGATFARGAGDAVAPDGGGYRNSDWWRQLAEWHPNDGTESRTIAELVGNSANDFVLVAVSSVYADALSEDLETTVRTKSPGDRLAIISAGYRCGRQLEPFQMPAAGRLKNNLRGAMQSLNARIARAAVSRAVDWYPSRAKLYRLMQASLEAAPPMTRHDRKRLDDEEIRKYIQESLREDPGVTHTRLLRALRDKGLACEQSRFAALFREARSDVAALHRGGAEAER